MTMKFRGSTFDKIDLAVTGWMSAHGITLLRLSVGIVFLWFGGLKYFTGFSPAEEIATRTIQTLSFGLLTEKVILYGLATWEVLIGLGLLLNIFLRETLLLLFLQMVGTFMPVFMFPSEVFASFPFSLTLEGQYIFKNLVLLSAGIVLGATVRGAKLKT